MWRFYSVGSMLQGWPCLQVGFIQIDRQTDKMIDEHIDMHTVRRRDIQTTRKTIRLKESQTIRQLIIIQTDNQTGRQIDRWKDIHKKVVIIFLANISERWMGKH